MLTLRSHIHKPAKLYLNNFVSWDLCPQSSDAYGRQLLETLCECQGNLLADNLSLNQRQAMNIEYCVKRITLIFIAWQVVPSPHLSRKQKQTNSSFNPLILIREFHSATPLAPHLETKRQQWLLRTRNPALLNSLQIASLI